MWVSFPGRHAIASGSEQKCYFLSALSGTDHFREIIHEAWIFEVPFIDLGEPTTRLQHNVLVQELLIRASTFMTCLDCYPVRFSTRWNGSHGGGAAETTRKQVKCISVILSGQDYRNRKIRRISKERCRNSCKELVISAQQAYTADIRV